jgi:hypothetical protein
MDRRGDLLSGAGIRRVAEKKTPIIPAPLSRRLEKSAAMNYVVCTMKKTILLLSLGFCLVVGSAADAIGGPITGGGPHKGFYLGALYASIGNPLYRFPSGSEQLSIPGTSGNIGFLAGYDFAWNALGVGARIVYSGGAFQDFAAPQMPGMTFAPYAKYTDPKLSFIFLDLLLSWYPGGSGLFGVYGYLALGSGTESYTISGSDFPQWNGSKSLTEFRYGFGGGLRFTPLRFISLVGDLRLVAGDLVTEYTDFLYSDGTWNYYGNANQKTKYTTLLSFGLSINF